MADRRGARWLASATSSSSGKASRAGRLRRGWRYPYGPAKISSARSRRLLDICRGDFLGLVQRSLKYSLLVLAVVVAQYVLGRSTLPSRIRSRVLDRKSTRLNSSHEW